VGGALTPVAAGPAWRRPVTIGPVAHTYTVPAAVLGLRDQARAQFLAAAAPADDPGHGWPGHHGAGHCVRM
jgi:hypothetical protein